MLVDGFEVDTNGKSCDCRWVEEVPGYLWVGEKPERGYKWVSIEEGRGAWIRVADGYRKTGAAGRECQSGQERQVHVGVCVGGAAWSLRGCVPVGGGASC